MNLIPGTKIKDFPKSENLKGEIWLNIRSVFQNISLQKISMSRGKGLCNEQAYIVLMIQSVFKNLKNLLNIILNDQRLSRIFELIICFIFPTTVKNFCKSVVYFLRFQDF